MNALRAGAAPPAAVVLLFNPTCLSAKIQHVPAHAIAFTDFVVRPAMSKRAKKAFAWKEETSRKPARLVLLVPIVRTQGKATRPEEHVPRLMVEEDVRELVHEIT